MTHVLSDQFRGKNVTFGPFASVEDAKEYADELMDVMSNPAPAPEAGWREYATDDGGAYHYAMVKCGRDRWVHQFHIFEDGDESA